jgi:hypothetical protein
MAALCCINHYADSLIHRPTLLFIDQHVQITCCRPSPSSTATTCADGRSPWRLFSTPRTASGSLVQSICCLLMSKSNRNGIVPTSCASATSSFACCSPSRRRLLPSTRLLMKLGLLPQSRTKPPRPKALLLQLESCLHCAQFVLKVLRLSQRPTSHTAQSRSGLFLMISLAPMSLEPTTLTSML